MTAFNQISTSDNLLPLSIIKQRAKKTPIDSAEFYLLNDGSLCMFLLNDQQRTLVARKQGDVFRTWRSIDRAVALLKTHFALSTIRVFLSGSASEISSTAASKAEPAQ